MELLEAWLPLGGALSGLIAATISVIALLVFAGFRAATSLRTANAESGVERLSQATPAPRSIIRPYRSPLTAAMALTVLMILLELAAPWPLKVIVDNAIDEQALPSWLGFLEDFSRLGIAATAAAAGVALAGASALTGYLVEYLLGATEARLGADLRSATFRRVERASLSFHDANRSGDLAARLTTDVTHVEEMLIARFDVAFREILTLAGMFVILLVIDVPLTIVALVVVPLLAYWATQTHRIVKRAQRQARDESGALVHRATDLLRHVRAVQAFAQEEETGTRFQAANDHATDAAIEVVEKSARLYPIADIVLAVGSAVVLYLGVARVIDGRLTLGVLFVILTYLHGLYDPIRNLSALVPILAKGNASLERISELFTAEPAVAEHPNPRAVPAGPCVLEVKKVTVGYEPTHPVLEDVSFRAEPGRTVCVVGSTGAGKSTLLSLLLRLYDPDKGRIELGGTDIRRLGIEAYRHRVALVPQDLWIVDGTIADNIAFGVPEAEDSEIRRVGRLTLVDEFVEHLPAGYETLVGEDGVLLSGGQKRRIALARALLRDPAVLVLDEPTSGLDAESEAKVLDVVKNVAHNRTVIIVSHRLNIARLADEVVVLERGAIVEQGGHLELLFLGERYKELWRLQRNSGNGHRPTRGTTLEAYLARIGSDQPADEGR